MRRFAVFAIALAFSLALPILANADKTGQNAKPVARASLELPSGTTSVHIPFRIVGGHIVVRVRLGDRDMDFAFDTGASTTVLNADVFKAMALDPQNKSALADLTIGDAILHDVTVSPNPIYEHQEDTAVVGLIGGDLTKRAVVRIDYDANTLDIIKPGSFTPPQAAAAIPVRSGYTVPIVSATIGQATGDDFILDTGAWPVAVFQQFAGAHPEVFNKDTERKGARVPTEPICGTVVTSPYEVAGVRVGEAAAVPKWLVLLVPQTSCFNMRLDGLIGYDYLRFFTVTIDLPESRVYLELLKKYARIPAAASHT